MKNDKTTKPASKEKSGSTTTKKATTGKNGEAGSHSDQEDSATSKARAKTGHGLGNEGTVVSYEEGHSR